jgi:hypothetical protein
VFERQAGDAEKMRDVGDARALTNLVAVQLGGEHERILEPRRWWEYGPFDWFALVR